MCEPIPTPYVSFAPDNDNDNDDVNDDVDDGDDNNNKNGFNKKSKIIKGNMI